ncbi:POTRA domain-containing protein [Vagococcus sp. WN89Y]|uniref:POTRA domain-containing protein n=1 Tax=Vagococcus sp. WN89Y TaxID=3457258 RepID=UPI003FCD6C59
MHHSSACSSLSLAVRKGCILFGAIVLPLFIFSQPLLAATPNSEQLIIQQQRQKALEQQLTPLTPDVRLSPPSSSFGRIAFPQEKTCFPIDQVELSGQDKLPHWLSLQRIANQAQGRCLGGQGINLLMSTLQNRLVDRGYITTRVLAPRWMIPAPGVPGVIRAV